MRYLNTLAMFIVVILILSLVGCGSSRDSDGVAASGSDALANAATLGITNCVTCHSASSSLQTFTWLTSPNNPHTNSSTSLKSATSSCAPCHNRLQDGQLMPDAFFAEGSPLSDARNVTSCESCHGGGQFHNGIAAGIPFPQPTDDQCGVCHGAGMPSWHPDESKNLSVGFATSPHNNSLNEHVFDEATPTEVRARCSKCHTAQGARNHRLIAGDHDQLVTAFDGVENETRPTAVECQACHMPHEEGVPLLDTDDVFTGSLQYNTCTNCHQLTYPLLDYTGAAEPLAGQWMQDTYHAPPVNPYGDYGEIISDTHWDDPATSVIEGSKIIEGYVVKNTSDSACSDCHNLHNNDNTINNQWANSAHGGHIAEAKENAETNSLDVFAAGSNDNSGTPGFAAAWAHYDWDAMAGGFSGTGRQSCQRCHTATGASNYMDNPAGYSSASNDFSHLIGWPAGADQSSEQNEMLYCWGCHSDASLGDLRAPGAITEDYGNGAVVNYPDINNANVCMTCHIGREIGGVIQGSTADFSNTGFVNSHYLAAGASVFAVSGFEFPGMNYNNVSFFAHDSIGTTFEVATHGEDVVLTDDDMGPCVGCHLTSEEGHKFLPFEINAAGSAFDYITPVCAECHNGEFALTAAVIEEEEEGYAASIKVLEVALSEAGFPFLGGYPYFSNTNWIPPLGTTQDGKNTMGAAFNYNLAAHEPGGFAHNRFYYKRLLWDSIDWMDDFTMNDSVPATISTFQTGGLITPAESTEASSYLGTSRPGTGIPDRAAIPGLDPT